MYAYIKCIYICLYKMFVYGYIYIETIISSFLSHLVNRFISSEQCLSGIV